MMSEIDNQVSEAHFNRALTGNIHYGPDCIRIKRNDTSSETKLFNEHNTQKISTRKTNNGEPVVVISNLDSDHDITTMMGRLLSKKEFSDTSSIFVVVPTSDDNNSDLSSECSTIGIQLSQHYPNWNQKQSNVEELDQFFVPTFVETMSRRNSSTTSSLQISAKRKKYCMEGMQETAISVHENKSIYHHTVTNSCSHEKRKNQFCQISTPSQNRMLYHSVSTDTTSDRPCCCAIKICGNHNLLPENPYVADVVSELFTGFPVNRGQNCDGRFQLPKMNVTQQASFESINSVPMSVSPCAVPACSGHPGCYNPSDLLQIPYGTPMPLPVPETTKAAWGPNQSGSCRCSPEKLKEIFKEVLKEMAPNFNSTVCGVAADNPPTYQAANSNTHFELVNSDSGDDEDDRNCSYHRYMKGYKRKCASSGKRRTIGI